MNCPKPAQSCAGQCVLPQATFSVDSMTDSSDCAAVDHEKNLTSSIHDHEVVIERRVSRACIDRGRSGAIGIHAVSASGRPPLLGRRLPAHVPRDPPR